MIHRSLHLTFLFALAVSSIFVGCGSSSSDPSGSGSGSRDFSGIWDAEGEVVGKRTCNLEIGDRLSWEIQIAQDANSGTISFGGTPTPFTLEGSTLTALLEEESDIEVSLTIDGDELSGSATATGFFDGSPCTQIMTISGTRRATAPSSDFAGDWDFSTTITSSTCEGEPFGSMEDICRSIRVESNTVIMDDEDGQILGASDGDTVELYRLVEGDEELWVQLTVSGNTISGTIDSRHLDDACRVEASITGSKRTTACPPPPEPGDLAGSWFVDVNHFGQFGCGGAEASDYIGPCIDVSVDGSSISVDDGSGLGLLTGTMDGGVASVTRIETDGVFTLDLELIGERLIGDLYKEFTSGVCNGASVEINFDGTALPLPCLNSGGPFGGAWSIALAATDNGCNLSANSTACVEFFQNGNLVIEPGENRSGTVSGSTLTMQSVDIFSSLDSKWTFDIVLTQAGGGTSLSGTYSITIESLSAPGDVCTSIYSATGTPTAPCPSDKLSVFGAKALGSGSIEGSAP